LNKSIAIEDIGIVIIDHYGVVVSQYLLSALLENNVAVIICNQSHLPNGLFLNLDGNQVQSEMFKHQINATIPLKKQLWQQTIFAKISNQTELLRRKGIPAENMLKWAKNVKSGDPDNLEARAANYYLRKVKLVFSVSQINSSVRWKFIMVNLKRKSYLLCLSNWNYFSKKHKNI
jgi:CRISP-associated protein Cas1